MNYDLFFFFFTFVKKRSDHTDIKTGVLQVKHEAYVDCYRRVEWGGCSGAKLSRVLSGQGSEFTLSTHICR